MADTKLQFVAIEKIGPAIDADCMLPHHRLHAWWALAKLAVLIHGTPIPQTHFRDHAQRAIASALTNVIEGAARTMPGEQRRAFSIARGEAAEAAGAVESSGLLGGVPQATVREVLRAASLAVKLLGGLAR